MAVPVPMAELRPPVSVCSTTELGGGCRTELQEDCDQHHGVVLVPPWSIFAEAVSKFLIQIPSRHGLSACDGE